jgi:molybdate transport system permease protein
MELTVSIYKRLPHYDLDVSFRVEGETLGLLGSSGSGKSMTLRCIAGMQTPNRGMIVMNNRTLYDSQRKINVPSRQRKVGFLFQNYALFPHLTVAENIAYGLNKLPRFVAQQRVREQLHAMQLIGLEDRYPHQLSGGQQQRVALARALVTEPDLLLLDEPFSALDTHLRSELEKQLIRTLSRYRGLTLFVSHNLEEAYRVCQKLVVLDQGKIIAAGDKQRIFDHPETLAVAQLTGCKNCSTLQRLNTYTLRAVDWHCTLQTIEPITHLHAYVGIRAHHISFFTTADDQPNTFPAWVVWISETPHRMTIYLKLGTPPVNADDYHLQAEVFKEKWDQLKDRPMPWLVHLNPARLHLLQG